MDEMKYLDLVNRVINEGIASEDRTGTGTMSVFGAQVRFDLTKGFPLLTTKKMITRSIIHELLWFLKGETNIQYLKDNNVKIWDAWADENGELGPVYGKQWRDCNGIDQIKQVIESIKTNPYSRRHIVNSWNVSDVEKMALPPCHTFFQFYVRDRHLSLQLYQRSGDLFLGVPFNIASYSLLLSMVAQVTNLIPYEFIHTFGDVHIYNNHLKQVITQILRDPYDPPKLVLNPEITDIFDFTFDDIKIENYKCHPRIKAPISV